jgi:nucleotide-binding universal stress UspA family protein
MSIFPTKILLATDGSEEAILAATTAADLAKSTGSELHVLHVGAGHPLYEASGLSAMPEEVLDAQRREAQRVLDEQVRMVEDSGVAVEEAPSTLTSDPTGRLFT